MVSGASHSKKHLEVIGLITVNFAMLESTIKSGIWELLTVDQLKGQIITAELSFKGLVALIASLFRNCTASKTRMEKLEQILKRLISAEEKRNVITHSVWAVGESKETITRIKTTSKMKNGLKHQFQPYTVDDLDSIAEEIADVAADFQMFWLSELKYIKPVRSVG